MDPVCMSSLFLAEEEKLKNELRADELIDRDRARSVSRLNELLENMLLRYNAAYSDDPARQALADCQAASVRDMLALITAGTAQKEITRRRVRTGALITLLLAVIFGLLAVLLVKSYYLAGCICIAPAALFAFLSGRLWYGEREVRVHAGLDPDVILKTLRKVTGTIDRKTQEVLDQEQVRLHAAAESGKGTDGATFSPEDLEMIAGLLEALYADNGDYALRQLKKILPWLRRYGVETQDYTEETRELFEVLPTKRASATLRPALTSEDRLLLAGRAVRHMD